MATELQRGFPLLRQQTTALLKKNILLSLRNKRTTFLHLFSSLFFIALLFGIQKATDYRSRHPSAVSAVPDPQAATNPAIPACEHKLFIKRPCFDFAWSGSSSSRIQAIVAGILANNPGRPIPASKVRKHTIYVCCYIVFLDFNFNFYTPYHNFNNFIHKM
nr:ABC transporter A family member 9-like [Ipomoea trifida]